jgi:hypothetical protein
MVDDEPRPIARAALPARVVELLRDDEVVLYAETPIRRAGGLGVWLILGLGIAFVPASTAALIEIAERTNALPSSMKKVAALVLAGGLGLVFFAFSLMLLCWPFLAEWSRRRTLVVVTDARVLRFTGNRVGAKPLRVKDWDIAHCEHASVARRRGASATLVLKERIRTRQSDGQPVYEWDALHGLPDADAALSALLWARARRERAIV